MKLYFTKFQNAKSFFSKKANGLSAELLNNEVIISCIESLYYSGHYTIIGKTQEDSEKEMFLIVESNYLEEFELSNLDMEHIKLLNIDMYMVLHRNLRKICIVDRELNGIIMKN